MFDADRPITSSNQDRLNRTVFAKYLARSMLDHRDPESLVIGLYGSWGVGKTSVINLVVEELNFAASNLLDEEKPIILNFSPWSYSGQNQLIYNFFRRLSSALRSASYLENSNRIIDLLELYVSFFTHQPIPKSLRAKPSFLEKLGFKKRKEVYAWESGRDLTQVKSELNELLREQHHKIIIIIDNISRLYDYEIKQLFQIVKSMGDYTNTAYLLAFDQKQVANAINHLDGSGGDEFIEKIVQLPFDIPPILQQDLENIFTDRLKEVMLVIPEDTWSVEYWADIYYNSIKYFFENCRDITRYVNTLQFSYIRLSDVVNPVDFFALTALEVFSPNIYFAIRENKDLFTDLLDHVYQIDSAQLKNDKLRCEEILTRDPRISRERILALLIRLFPRIRKIYFPNELFYHSNQIARKLRRICSPDLFDVYFRLSMQTGQIIQSEFETLLSLAKNQVAFDQALTRLNQDDRITKFLDQLDTTIIDQIPTNHIGAIINALLDNGDLFPQGTLSQLSLDTPMRIHRIIHRLLQRFPQSEDRFLILQNAIAKANKSLYISIHELAEQSREHFEESDTHLPLSFRDLMPEQLESLRKLMISRIAVWADNGSLIDHPKLIAILFAWIAWGGEVECKQFIQTIVKSDRGLIAFLSASLSKAIDEVTEDYEKNPGWVKYIEDIEFFIPIDALETHAKLLFEDAYFEKLREREQLALMIFLDLIEADTQKNIPSTTIAN